jgi:hypothetical protein
LHQNPKNLYIFSEAEKEKPSDCLEIWYADPSSSHKWFQFQPDTFLQGEHVVVCQVGCCQNAEQNWNACQILPSSSKLSNSYATHTTESRYDISAAPGCDRVLHMPSPWINLTTMPRDRWNVVRWALRSQDLSCLKMSQCKFHEEFAINYYERANAFVVTGRKKALGCELWSSWCGWKQTTTLAGRIFGRGYNKDQIYNYVCIYILYTYHHIYIFFSYVYTIHTSGLVTMHIPTNIPTLSKLLCSFLRRVFWDMFQLCC